VSGRLDSRRCHRQGCREALGKRRPDTIPNEQRSPFVASGIRVGSAAATSRGFTKEDFYEVGQCIAATVFNAADEAKLADVKAKIDAMLEKHPLYPGLEY